MRSITIGGRISLGIILLTILLGLVCALDASAQDGIQVIGGRIKLPVNTPLMVQCMGGDEMEITWYGMGEIRVVCREYLESE